MIDTDFIIKLFREKVTDNTEIDLDYSSDQKEVEMPQINKKVKIYLNM